MDKQSEQKDIVGSEQLIVDLGRAIESVDANLADITGGVSEIGDGGDDIYICKSRCA